MSVKLITEWSTDHPGLAAQLKRVDELPETDPDRHELLAVLHLAQARLEFQHAERLRITRGRR